MSGTRAPTPTRDVGEVPTADLCVRVSCETHTVCGSGATEQATTDVDVGENVPGIDINIYSEILSISSNCAKEMRHEHGMI